MSNKESIEGHVKDVLHSAKFKLGELDEEVLQINKENAILEH